MAKFTSPKKVRRVSHAGPPPHIGWWECSRYGSFWSDGLWRWWDGKNWSYDARSNTTIEHAVLMAAEIAYDQYEIRWTKFYPANARVPRIAP